MANVLQAHRVHFQARDDGDDESVSGRFSNHIDLASYRLRAIEFPKEGVGTLRALVRSGERDKQTQVEIAYTEAIGFSLDLAVGDDPEAGSWIEVEKDWPFMDTVLVLDTARDEDFYLILVTELRG